MLTAVDFISRDAFDQVLPAADLAVISIGDPAELPPKSFGLHARALRMEFLDCDLAGLAKWGYPEEALCTQAQVQQMAAFIQSLHAEPAAWRLVVHCRMGASRSAAVALMAQAMTGCAMPRQAEANYANAHVLMLAREQLRVAITVPPTPNGDEYVFLLQKIAI